MQEAADLNRVEIDLLGGFEVRVDGTPAPAEGWRRRQAAALVKLLALASGHRLHREQVIDALWPELSVDEAAPRLHKAAHFARKAAGSAATVVVHGEMLCLFPDAEVVVDALAFEQCADMALETGDPVSASDAADTYAGELLPDDLYEPWTEEPRQRLQLRHLELLRVAGRWGRLAELDPTDEEAHLQLMGQQVARGDRRAALRQFERLDRALRGELGVGPGPEAVALRDQLLAETPQLAPAQLPEVNGPLDREAELRTFEALVSRADEGRGGTLVLEGPAGMGKSFLLEEMVRVAEAPGLRAGRGTAAAIEGAWPYAPVLEAVSDLCRRDPALLEGLEAGLRGEIERALLGRALDLSGSSGHQRLFVAVGELLRLAASERAAVLVLDDMHEADEASLRLLHYLARTAQTEPLVLVLAVRTGHQNEELDRIRASLRGRDAAVELTLTPLERDAVRALVAAQLDDPSDALVEELWEASGGLPFNVVELARRAHPDGSSVPAGAASLVAGLSAPLRELLQRMAVAGSTFDTDELLALSGLAEDEAYAQLDAALATLTVEHTDSGFRFRHALVRDALLAELPPHRRRSLHREVAECLEVAGASPIRIAHHLIEAGASAEAVPHATAAARVELRMGAYRDALDLIDAVVDAAEGSQLGELRTMRGDCLLALGDRGAVQAYQQALEVTEGEAHRLARAQLSRAAMVAGDLDLARHAVEDLEPDGGQADAAILMARGNVAYFTGDIDAAYAATEQARSLVARGRFGEWMLLDLLSLQGLIAHTRGEWFERLRIELRATSDDPALATAMFDSQLCVAEYFLYGPTPYDEVIELAHAMREAARRSGAARALAFHSTLLGEAALLAGDLDRAEDELRAAADLHHELGAAAGEAHSLQRLAEVAVARGDREAALALLQQALPLARWSLISMHLLQRIYGTMLRAAPDPEAALAMLQRAEASLNQDDYCPFCNVMLAVPAAIACANGGLVTDAHRHLEAAEASAALWEGTAWQGALLEARAHLAAAEGDDEGARRLLEEGAAVFARAGQPLDAARCREGLAMPAA